MNKVSKFENIFLYSLVLSLLIFGTYLSYIGGYGSDEDTLPMIYVFERRLSDGTFVTSRFSGNPVPEIGIGFLAYYFGSFSANFVTFIFFFLSTLLISLSFKIKKIPIFLILCMSSQVLYFDNLEPIDYSWALFPFSIGIYLFSKKKYELAILFFGIAVGSRINFILFIIPIILFYKDEHISISNRLSYLFVVFIIGGLFYLPNWYDNSFGLEWLSSGRPISQGFFGLLSRFIYKTSHAFGILQLLLIMFILFFSQKLLFNFFKDKLTFYLVILNLLLFLYIPAELSYLQPAIIFTYLFAVNFFSKKIIYVLIILNFLNWGINYNYLEIKYSKEDPCKVREAVSADLKFKFEDGGIRNYLKSRDMIKCWAYNANEDKTTKILKGAALK
tara:strand:+ start:1941 stop:3104 length:1164 start_codon:yes stop_codon:yes gene_type:complete